MIISFVNAEFCAYYPDVNVYQCHIFWQLHEGAEQMQKCVDWFGCMSFAPKRAVMSLTYLPLQSAPHLLALNISHIVLPFAKRRPLPDSLTLHVVMGCCT